jgi:hypothetical protein
MALWIVVACFGVPTVLLVPLSLALISRRNMRKRLPSDSP